ncbi:MAG: hypothetical protein V3S82_10360 [Dehalococcoidia bacterium]
MTRLEMIARIDFLVAREDNPSEGMVASMSREADAEECLALEEDVDRLDAEQAEVAHEAEMIDLADNYPTLDDVEGKLQDAVRPQPGTFADTARLMVQLGVMTGDEADTWKDDMKDGLLF